MSNNYQKGMRGFGDQPGKRNDRWDRKLEKLEQPSLNKPTLIRPVAGLVTVAVHYLKFPPKPGKKGGGFFTLCPNWDLVDGDIDGDCPVCANFHRNLEIKNKRDEYLKMPQKLRYLFHAFHVSNIRKGVKDQPTFGLVETHIMGMESIEKAMLIKGNKPDEMKNGYCLVWLLSDSTKGSEYGPEVSFIGDEKMPVRRHAGKEGVWEIKIDGKVYEGVEQQIAASIPAPPTAAELDKKLASMGLWEALSKAVGTGSRHAATTDVTDDLDEDDTDDGFGDSDSAPADDPDEDDTTWDDKDSDEDDTSVDADEFDDEDEPEDTADGFDDDPDGFDNDDSDNDPDDAFDDDPDADDLEEEEPEPEPKPKKSGKKKASGKKQAKKPKKEEPKEDDDTENWDDF